MNHQEIMQSIHEIGLLPAVVLEEEKHAAPLAKALCSGSLPLAEVMLRTPAALDCLKAMHQACPDMLLGAGTVLSKEQVLAARDAGASFIVTPGLNPEIVTFCQKENLPVIPGISSASELDQARRLGLKVVKFFPAEPLGGLRTIHSLAAVWQDMYFLPSGGIDGNNMMSYLQDERIFAVGGTWMVKKDLIAKGQFDEIASMAHDAILKMLQIHIAHIGINSDSAHGKQIASQFASLLDGNVRDAKISYFGSELVEVMITPNARGTYGHIAIGVTSVPRAVAFFKRKGYDFDESSVVKDEKGRIKLIYFKDSIAGFAIHLVQEA
ncbi:MAG: bifunctional 4-hydroxy-2-oxoglutarate aldolase/2-dehydro-3-deoxy-phosphogluconate aldolase [Lactimicrobium sp.]|jgi:2-dehydro-3-deoxyphosphogluconate aldolase/(4S)-4-hydroxy-2-oxoglutarate aldolase|uniref:bifunctional 4-hydroxy-2-oxoglutarate aldolase/2-dehydro-3-deoxy-phosphogluconate aldolase n=1 Tax=Lactimicrobium sp. TaxID=2563780 RepID=UPI002F35549D